MWPGHDPDQDPVRGGVGGDTGVVTWSYAALINEIQILFYVKSVKQNEIYLIGCKVKTCWIAISLQLLLLLQFELHTPLSLPANL